jgi:hypothetical protein
MVKSKRYKDCGGKTAVEIINREHPLFISLKFKESVNGDNDMMIMLSSIDVNTRLRVSIIDTETTKEYFNSFFRSLSSYILPGRHTHFHTP